MIHVRSPTTGGQQRAHLQRQRPSLQVSLVTCSTKPAAPRSITTHEQQRTVGVAGGLMGVAASAQWRDERASARLAVLSGLRKCALVSEGRRREERERGEEAGGGSGRRTVGTAGVSGLCP